MPGSIQANTAYDATAIENSIAGTCERIIRERIPNLLRPYVSPHVTQACYCLTKLVAEAWSESSAVAYQVFLANSGEEALSGAIKLARYWANKRGRSASGLILDPDGRFEHFAFTDLTNHGRLQYLPGVENVRDPQVVSDRLAEPNASVGFVVIPHAHLPSILTSYPKSGAVAQNPLLIVCTDSRHLTRLKRAPGRVPDIVVFDESFVNREVPFGAFAATARLHRLWTKRSMTTFHSTTYQPNTISTLHLVSCLRRSIPDFFARHQTALERIESDASFRFKLFRTLYSRSLASLASAAGLRDGCVRASGHYISTSDRKIFDGVAGVACSIRGHNPPTYVEELQQFDDTESCRDDLMRCLARLTGLSHMVPAVSGASAVEHALRIGLASQFPRDWVLALRGGFGGKTLLALTGTWKSSLRAGLAPLYPNVVYVDPFAPDAISAVASAFHTHPIGVVQLELVQGVGGVRAVPEAVLRALVELRQKYDSLLFVDEVQTGMYRTGPFMRSQEVGIEADLLTIGKGTSDMMFPFAMTLYSSALHTRLEQRKCNLPKIFHERYGYETGIRTVLNTLRQADRGRFDERVRARSRLFARLLQEQLASCRLVRDVRCFGLLIGIELDGRSSSPRWLMRLTSQLYLLAMLNEHRFPVLVGFCQYEPNVLKLTPPLSITEDEVRSVCTTIASVLHRPLREVAFSGFVQMMCRRWLQRPRPLSNREERP